MAMPNINARFPVYAVDFAVEAAGKRVAATKRRVRWRFGFPNSEAVERGDTGTACRGSEHEVNVVWSLTSGKRQITMDQKEVHYSVGRSGKFEFSWTMRGNHVLKIVAFATAPVNSPAFRQYDLLVDGQSFFDMPKIFEVGLAGPPQAQARVPGDYSQYRVESAQDREEQDLQAAIAASLRESRAHLETRNRELPPSSTPRSAPPAPSGDLLDVTALDIASAPNLPPPYPPTVPPQAAFSGSTFSESASAPSPFMSPSSVVTAPPPFQSPPPYASPGALSAATAPQPPTQPAVAGYLPAPPGAFPPGAPVPPNAPIPTGAQMLPGVPPAQPAPLFAPPPAAAQSGVPPAFAGQQPLPPMDDPFAPKPPSQSEVLSSIMDAYAANGPPATPGAPVPQPNFNTPNGAVNGTAPGAPAQASLSMNAPLAIAATEEDAKPKTEIEKAMSNLVNFDDINEPAEKEMKLTMMKEEDERKKRNPNKSIPLPPVATNMVASGATLSQIQQVKPEQAVKDPSTIMKPPPQLFSPEAVHAGALVVHGAPMPQGPPPIQQGFGVGYGPPPHQSFNGYSR